ncbi:hypothetical protein ACERIT_13285 [Halopenitus sp. H-Gu1]
MSAQVTDRDGLEQHLQEALEVAENDEARYHLRESLQKLQVE